MVLLKINSYSITTKLINLFNYSYISSTRLTCLSKHSYINSTHLTCLATHEKINESNMLYWIDPGTSEKINESTRGSTREPVKNKYFFKK